nr:unnamed protein product [Callosobruchus analis]
MLFYNVRQCLNISNFAGVNPLKNDMIQWLVYRIIILGALSVLYLEVLLLVYKEEKLTIIDFTEAYSGMSMVIHGIQRSSGLYFNKSTLAILIRRMETDFWSPDDIPLSKEEKQFFADTHQRLKTAFKMLILFCSLNSGCACFQTFFLPENVLAFVCYEPETINFWYIWTLQAFVMVFSIVVPIVSLDVMLMTILVLTELQFKLLNKEVETLFDVDANTGENVDKRIERVIRQHNFLLEYTKMINKTFSGPMLAYMAIIVSSMCVEMYNLSSG